MALFESKDARLARERVATHIGTSSNDPTTSNTATGTTAQVPEPKFPSHEELTEAYSRSMNLPVSEVGKVLTSMQELIQAVTQSRLWDRWLSKNVGCGVQGATICANDLRVFLCR